MIILIMLQVWLAEYLAYELIGKYNDGMGVKLKPQLF